MSTRTWIHEKESENTLCPFGPKPDFKNGNEEFKTSKCQGEFCMAWFWYSDVHPEDINDEPDNSKLYWGSCALIPEVKK